jgi:hypothetical protein
MTESDLFAVSEDGDLLVHLDDEGLAGGWSSTVTG